ncbi:UpxY family transcription antiterminator [Jejuia pallidilutea]|jgi:transcription antitermination factor NusG|uniref:Transcriptional activator RfaH n=1 Tax=Jejuia pallidilutea TaxID=504487 RepID=A0A090VS11_9FLAO|nr:UpxY family transcription antiterminator [Jejuia pallidilutea]GAL67500.1 transcriptional activator RfaH [Jejuia pallidilutea]GAL71300.1 transcriptional activator RfaH [Jejuia pallidilutea]GAL88724.1 transcriptional activator RfaH [Jejuia pallidilutea]
MFKNWYVLYVKPKNEKKVAETLSKAKLEVYCPTIQETKIWSDRKKTVEVPLFKSYIFVRLSEKERQIVFNFPGVIKYLFWLGKPAIVKDDEIETIREWLLSNDVSEYSVTTLTPGDRVYLKNSMLGGKEAIVKEVGKTRVRLILEDFGVVLNMKIKQIA